MLSVLACIMVVPLSAKSASGEWRVRVDRLRHVFRISEPNLRLVVGYDKRCVVDELWVGKRMVLAKSAGVFTGIRSGGVQMTSRHLLSMPAVETSDSSVVIDDILYGAGEDTVSEKWTFSFEGDTVVWRIERDLKHPMRVDDDEFPSLNIKSIGEYNGALLGNGGVAWFRLFNDSAIAYGVHTNLATFWKSRQDECLQVGASTPDRSGAIKFARVGDRLGVSFTCSPSELGYRYDPGTNRRRFIRGKTDVWAPTTYAAGKYVQVLRISAKPYEEVLGRGTFRGIDGNAVTSILNTIARLGVIDSRLYGGNSWHTPYGPICLHEQYIGQFGIGIDDQNYINGYKECLNYYRDHAIERDGRVKARWAYTNEDASPGSADSLGFYEAQWGMLLDSNPDFVINVADLFDQCGDETWLRGQKKACEAALDYMLRRDSNHDSLVEMFTKTHLEHRGSDWLDVIWASWEDAFVNAEMYHALRLWSGLEELLGDSARADHYRTFAAGLKRRFNAPISDGGFWDPKHGWYVHWREPDGSVWGDNLVTPVNFMAIGYGICDDPARRASILHAIDTEMEKENLFFWPICMFPYEEGAGGEQNFPFPNYENGDLFLSWGELGVRAFAMDYPEVALRYIRLLIRKYDEDGLAFQRYLRTSQKGAGDDILAGNASAIVGLYRDIYGIRPSYNRLYLEPHLVGDLYGTRLRYNFEGNIYLISLDGAWNAISTGNVSFKSSDPFGLKRHGEDVTWFERDNTSPSLSVRNDGKDSLAVTMLDWSQRRRWTEVASGGVAEVTHQLLGLKPNDLYAVYRDGRMLYSGKAGADGHLEFKCAVRTGNQQLFEVRQARLPGDIRPGTVISVSRPAIYPRDTLVFSPGKVTVAVGCDMPGAVVRYTLDRSVPGPSSSVYTHPLTLNATTVVKARAWREGLAPSVVDSSEVLFVPKDSTGVFKLGGKTVHCHKAFGANVALRYPYSPQYAASGPNALTDGLLGTDIFQNDWQGFEWNNLDATIDMGRLKSVDSVMVGFLQNPSLWIHYPVRVDIYTSADGRHFKPLNVGIGSEHNYGNGFSRRSYFSRANGAECRYIRVHAVNIHRCPPGSPGAGGKAWLFVDEVIAE